MCLSWSGGRCSARPSMLSDALPRNRLRGSLTFGVMRQIRRRVGWDLVYVSLRRTTMPTSCPSGGVRIAAKPKCRSSMIDISLSHAGAGPRLEVLRVHGLFVQSGREPIPVDTRSIEYEGIENRHLAVGLPGSSASHKSVFERFLQMSHKRAVRSSQSRIGRR